MAGKVISNKPQVFFVPVLRGAPEALVPSRQLRNKYMTNRDIKTWSAYFLLKSLTTSGVIHKWGDQLPELCDFFQCCGDIVEDRIDELVELKLCKKGLNLTLASYETAAAILDIPYCGTIKLKYDLTKHVGKQFFRFILMSEEIRVAKNSQVGALYYYIRKNPLLMQQLEMILLQFGADPARLRDPQHFQERLLELQLRTFRDGSECYDVIMHRRADCNRSARRIKKDHNYLSEQTVAYWKRILTKHRIIDVRSRAVESNVRSRLYYTKEKGTEKEAIVDGYRYIRRKKLTKLFLTHQITTLHEVSSRPENQKNLVAAAA